MPRVQKGIGRITYLTHKALKLILNFLMMLSLKKKTLGDFNRLRALCSQPAALSVQNAVHSFRVYSYHTLRTVRKQMVLLDPKPHGETWDYSKGQKLRIEF